MNLSVTELAALFLLLYGLLHWLGIMPGTRAVLALLGTVTLGTQGFAGRILGDIGAWLSSIGGAVTQWLFGVSISAAVFLIALVILLHDFHPKNSAAKRTGYAAIVVGICLASAIATIPALAPVAGAIHSLMSTLVGFVNSL